MLRALLLVCVISSQLFSQASGAPKPRVPSKVYVYDVVSSPIAVPIGDTGLTVLQALTKAVGLNATAKMHEADIIRRTENGPSFILLDIQGMIQEKTPDVTLQANDSLYLPEGSGKPLEELFAKATDPVPEVNPADLKVVWKLYAEANAHNSDEVNETSLSMLEILPSCKPGTDVRAILNRIASLRLLMRIQEDPETQGLLPWKKVTEVNDKVLELLATIPMHFDSQPQSEDDNQYAFDVNRLVDEAK